MAQSSESRSSRGIRASQEFQKANGNVANHRYIGNESTAGDRSCAGKKSPSTHRENIEGRTQVKPSYINSTHTRSHIDALNQVRPNKKKRAPSLRPRPLYSRSSAPTFAWNLWRRVFIRFGGLTALSAACCVYMALVYA
jgi:hypothetical protein